MRRPGSQSPFQVIPKVLEGAEVRALCGSVKFVHVGIGKYLPQTVPTMLEAWHCLKSFTMMKHYNYPSLEMRGLKNSPIILSLLYQNLQLAQAGRFYQHMPDPDSPICLANREPWLTSLQSMLLLPHNPVSVCCIPWKVWHCTWWYNDCMHLLSYWSPYHEASAAQVSLINFTLVILMLEEDQNSLAMQSAQCEPALWFYGSPQIYQINNFLTDVHKREWTQHF